VTITDPTFIGQVASVTGGIVRVRLRQDMPSTLIMVEGQSYRIGQIGAFYRIPLGYTQLYGVCTQVGADAAPPHPEVEGLALERETEAEDRLSGYRWMTIALFGESVGKQFDRGVGQYPTVGDEVHLVTDQDLKIIYSSETIEGTINIGSIAASTGIPARLDISGLVSRHCALVGSTGSGKSNLATVLLESIAAGDFPSARVLIIDPHGEYSTAVGDKARVFKLSPDENEGERHLWVPFWALPFDELGEITFGGLQPIVEMAVRDQVLDMKKESAEFLKYPTPLEVLTADSPIPFSIKKLWFELDDFERKTFNTTGGKEEDALDPEEAGDPNTLTPNLYPLASPYNQPPYKNPRKRNIERQLELMRSRLMDTRFAFLFNPQGGYIPDLTGRVSSDLDTLVSDWVGHDRPITVLDVSGLPSEILPAIVGTMLRVIYDTLFWATDLPVGGREQPLLVVLEEAHQFLPEGVDTSAHRTLSMIAKEGRKYGVGLMLVTQRPVEIDSTVLSQCGTMISLRITNASDRAKVAAALPDDLGGLSDLLPSLRTGEGLFIGEAMLVPSRVRIRKALNKPIGDDPKLPEAWQEAERPSTHYYTQALAKWRARSTSIALPELEEAGETEENNA